MAAELEKLNEPDLPEEITESLQDFDQSIEKVEEVFKPLLESTRDELRKKLTSLEQAKLDLLVAYAINAMFWMYLVTQGVNPKEHPVKQELDRIKKYMAKVKDATEKKQASVRIDKGAAGRFVKSALWQAKEHKDESKEEDTEKDTLLDHNQEKSRKRESNESGVQTLEKSKKKKKSRHS